MIGEPDFCELPDARGACCSGVDRSAHNGPSVSPTAAHLLPCAPNATRCLRAGPRVSGNSHGLLTLVLQFKHFHTHIFLPTQLMNVKFQL